MKIELSTVKWFRGVRVLTCSCRAEVTFRRIFIANTDTNISCRGHRIENASAHIQMELIRPVTNNFVLGCSVSDLVLVDLIASRGISVFIEEHWVASYA